VSDDAPLEIRGLSWPEVREGDDLAAMLLEHSDLRDGDVVALTSKVVSKAEGRAVPGARADAISTEAARVLARRGDSVIAETRHGLVLAAAGVDSSNVAPGTSLLLPVEPDRTARELRAAVYDRAGMNVAVVITDTAGRAWRNGQVDLAIGCAGLAALTDLSGTTDPFGNVLIVTAPATADEIASAGDLVKGKTRGHPVAVLRGLTELVLPPGDHGLGAAELVRPSELDLFGLGTREAAVAAALRTDPVALAHFPPRVPVDPPPFADVIADDPAVRLDVTPLDSGWLTCVLVADGSGPDAWLSAGRIAERCAVIAAAHRMTATDVPSQQLDVSPGWRPVTTTCWVGG
jgi:coenzyme F420-0:L-glutamate ligase/coenzyme F420-1:gamma-L-glutamate ligase